MNKYLEKKLNRIVDKHSVMVVEEKHATRIFDASSKEAIFRSSLILLKERMKSNSRFYCCPNDDYVNSYKPELSQTQIDALPDGNIKNEALNQVKRYNKIKKSFDADIEEWLNINKAIVDKDGEAAFIILETRCDYEYEGFHFTSLEGTK